MTCRRRRRWRWRRPNGIVCNCSCTPKLIRSVILWFSDSLISSQFQRKKKLVLTTTLTSSQLRTKNGEWTKPPNRWATVCVCVTARVCVLVSLSKLPSQMTMGSTPAGQYWLTTNAMQTTATTSTTTTTNTNTNTCSSSNYNNGDSAVLLVFR